MFMRARNIVKDLKQEAFKAEALRLRKKLQFSKRTLFKLLRDQYKLKKISQ